MSSYRLNVIEPGAGAIGDDRMTARWRHGLRIVTADNKLTPIGPLRGNR
jgi:hypothetical protein